ncbi:hypothetical protein SH467x_000877 [Pirellulaceae bacterium SH467]|jgi:hypothetical protein
MNLNRPRPFLILSSTLLALGCSPSYEGKQSPDSQAPATATLQSTGPKTRSVDNPDYLNWAKFPIGTRVVRKNNIVNEQGTVTVTTTLKLVEIDKSMAKVESQITVERPSDLTVNPPQILEYLAKQSVLESTTDEQVVAPLREAKLLRDETMSVLGKDVAAKVYTWKTALESGPAGVVGWYSDEIPGRQVKQEIDFGKAGKGTEEITSLETPAETNP